MAAAGAHVPHGSLVSTNPGTAVERARARHGEVRRDRDEAAPSTKVWWRLSGLAGQVRVSVTPRTRNSMGGSSPSPCRIAQEGHGIHRRRSSVLIGKLTERAACCHQCCSFEFARALFSWQANRTRCVLPLTGGHARVRSARAAMPSSKYPYPSVADDDAQCPARGALVLFMVF